MSSKIADLAGPGIDMITESLAKHRATGDELEVPYFLGLLAESLGEAGRVSEARAVVEEAFALLARTGERWFEAELCRIRAELLLADTPEVPGTTARELQRALEIARQQHARIPELRSACALARLWISQDRAAEADALLRPICSAFDEDGADLDMAESLLQQAAGQNRSLRL